VIFSCEGAPTAYLAESSGPSSLLTYLDNGGRVFASHDHFAWFEETNTNPANPFAALSPPLATWSNTTVPAGCAVRALTPQEQALEFMIFDLSSCLGPVGESPQAPATRDAP
jgi:hypothetical protein